MWQAAEYGQTDEPLVASCTRASLFEQSMLPFQHSPPQSFLDIMHTIRVRAFEHPNRGT